jgi:raffinose/stachyose/melibiose transport system permease protein
MGPSQPSASGVSVALGRRALSARYRMGRARRGQLGLAVAFIAPAALIYAYFMVAPFLNTIWLSLTSWDGFALVPEFIGFDNYARLLGDDRAWHALGNNVIWAIVGTAAPVIIGLALAIALWSGARYRTVFRTIYFLPFILPLVVVGIIWGWIYHPIYGIPFVRGILGDRDTALLGILVTAVWGYFGFVVVVFLAGLQNVSLDLIDASKVDGANALQRGRHVILPQIAPVFTTVTTITLVGAFSVFDIVFVMTSGGPGNASEVLALYTYNLAFRFNQMGYSSAVSTLITVLSLGLAVAFVRFRERAYRDVY